MLWEDDDIAPKAKRAVGRPVENPFASAEVEEDFARRGAAMIDLYYRPGLDGANTRHDFVFDERHCMSKTQFWSIIYIYYITSHRIVKPNLQGFLSAVQRHFGTAVASDRAAISRNVNSQLSMHVNYKHGDVLARDNDDSRTLRRYRSMYLGVTKFWEQLGD